MMQRGEQSYRERVRKRQRQTHGGGGVWVVSRNRLAGKSRRRTTLRCLKGGFGIRDSGGERREEKEKLREERGSER